MRHFGCRQHTVTGAVRRGQSFEALCAHREGVITEVTPALATLLGRPPDSLVGLRLIDVFDVEAADALATCTSLFDEAQTIEAALHCPKGNRIDVELTTCVDDGVTITLVRDVSRYKKIVRDLHERAALEDLVTSISAKLIAIEPRELDGEIDLALAHIGEFAKVDRSYFYLMDGDEMNMVSVWARGRPEASEHRGMRFPVEPFRWAIERLERGEHVVFEKIEKQDDVGDSPWSEAASSRLRSSCVVPMLSSDRLIGYVGFDALHEAKAWSDETIRLLRTVGYVFASAIERTRAQRSLADALENLEIKVEERTRELKRKHSQLVQSEKMASLGELVAGVAHEINTPLGAIKSNHKVLGIALTRIREAIAQCPALEDEVSRTVHRALDGAETVSGVDDEAIERIVRIVRSLRHFARLDQAERDKVDIHEGIDTTLTLVQHQLKGRIRVHKSYGDLPEVDCFPNQMNQVFMNLLVNASQAIDGAGDIYVETRREGDEVVVQVRDTGSGIPEDSLSKIFDPGFTTKGVGVGTGLGLSIVHQIVGDHGGRVEVTSTLGRGTSFSVVLPMVAAPQSRARTDPAPTTKTG